MTFKQLTIQLHPQDECCCEHCGMPFIDGERVHIAESDDGDALGCSRSHAETALRAKAVRSRQHYATHHEPDCAIPHPSQR